MTLTNAQVLIHPELITLYQTWYIADLDYEDNRGSNNAQEFIDRVVEARAAFRQRRAELEAIKEMGK